MEAHTNNEISNKDFWCRNCRLRFVPTYWVGAGYNSLAPQCIRCGSNATEPYVNQQTNKGMLKGILRLLELASYDTEKGCVMSEGNNVKDEILKIIKKQKGGE